MAAGGFSDFLTALGQYESGNNYGFVSSLGYLGRFQFAEEALTDVGFYVADGTGSYMDFAGQFTPWAAATFGVTDKASFLRSPAAQDDAVQKWFGKIISDIKMLGLDQYVGKNVAGIDITTSGLIAGTHLVGVWNLGKFLASGGSTMPQDGYGTTVAKYVQLFGGYETPFSLGSASASAGEMTGGSGDDVFHGGAGADTISGGGGSDYLRGHDGDDQIWGGDGFDDLQGNAGADTVHGGRGPDWVVGGKDNDQLFGDEDDDVVLGNIGSDSCYGGDGADHIRGGQGDDLVYGEAGDDWLAGDRGNDTLSGGAGADTFHTWSEAGIDRVVDFNAAEGDRVNLLAGTAYTLRQVGADTVIDMGGGNQMILVGVNSAALPQGWIFGA